MNSVENLYFYIFVICCFAASLLMTILLVMYVRKAKKGTLTQDAIFHIKNIISMSEIYVYNHPVAGYFEKESQFMVSYEGRVTLGIVGFPSCEVDEKKKKIFIKLPELKILSSELLPGSIDVIFNTRRLRNISMEKIGTLCENDMKDKIRIGQDIKDIASRNLQDFFRSLLCSYKKYEVVFIQEGENV